MSLPNRRTTLGGVTDNRPSAKGGKPRGSRMSMIPRVGRENAIPLPTAAAAASQTKNRRKTLGVHPVPAKASTGVKQAHANDRRQSIGVSANSASNDRRQSISAPSATVAARQDTRPINDKNFQKDCIQRIFQFLINNGYNHPISPRTLARPSGRDFSLIVTFMLRKVDCCFHTGTMKFEDEVAMTFKALGYPFPVSKTALVAAGSPHTWPALLAALNWLVDFLSNLQVDHDQDYEEDDVFESLEELEQKTDRIFFKYLNEAYIAFMKNDVQTSELLESELAEQFEKDDALVDREAERVTDLNASLCEAIITLKHEVNEISLYHNKKEKYAADLEQLHDLIAQMDERKIAYEAKIASRKNELDNTNRKLKQLNARVDELNKAIHSQKLSVADAERIEEDRKGLEEAIERKVKLKSQLSAKLSIIDEELQRLEEQIRSTSSKYNALISEISSLSLVKEKNAVLKASVNSSPLPHGTPSKILGVDPELIIQPSLSTCKEEYTTLVGSMQMKYRRTLEEMGNIEECLSAEASNLNDLHRKLSELEVDVKSEQEAHSAIVADHTRELATLENRLATLQDPSAIDEKYALIERRFAELKALSCQQHDEIMIKRQAIQDEVQKACEAIAKFEESYRRKVSELKLYADQKAANKPALKLPNI